MTAKFRTAVPREDLRVCAFESAGVEAPEDIRVESFWDEERRGNVIRVGRFTSEEDTREVFIPLQGNTDFAKFFNAEIAAIKNLLIELKLLPPTIP